ncbi:hypothetical protein BC567DRAFT_217248 [Phyllosticta citribraziliensis]
MHSTGSDRPMRHNRARATREPGQPQQAKKFPNSMLSPALNTAPPHHHDFLPFLVQSTAMPPSQSCGVCADQPPKYKCPSCELR